jgi:hypothetical protein
METLHGTWKRAILCQLKQSAGYPLAHDYNFSTWEAEMGAIIVQVEPRQGVHKTPSQPIAGCSGAHLSSQAT